MKAGCNSFICLSQKHTVIVTRQDLLFFLASKGCALSLCNKKTNIFSYFSAGTDKTKEKYLQASSFVSQIYCTSYKFTHHHRSKIRIQIEHIPLLDEITEM